MRTYFTFSFVLHGVFLAGLLVLGTLLSKPRMSYYAVDLLSSLPAGRAGVEPTVSKAPVPSPKAVKVAKRPEPPAAVERRSSQDTIRLLEQLKKKRLALQHDKAEPAPEAPAPEASAQSASENSAEDSGRVGIPGGGAGIVADAGVAFPYPWYLKTIADRLDKQWHPPQEFERDTVCQVTFVINREGQVFGSKITKPSGDALFDQLALRAVLYANPMPPLPSGFPDATLKVHMRFVGRRL